MATYIGTDKLKKLFLGTSEVKKVFVGTDLVYNSEVALTICGAPGETVTITGAYSGTVTLDSTGRYSFAKFPSGTSTFSGDFTTGKNSWVARVANLTSDSTIGLWPSSVDMIYWYGFWKDGASLSTNASGSGQSYGGYASESTYSGSRKRVTVNSWGFTNGYDPVSYNTQYAHFGKADFTDYSTINWSLETSRTGSGSAQTSAASGYSNSASGRDGGNDISSVTGEKYATVSSYAYMPVLAHSASGSGGLNVYVYECWLT